MILSTFIMKIIITSLIISAVFVSSEAGLYKVRYPIEGKGRYKRFAGSGIPTALGAADIHVESSSISEIKITSTYSNDSVKLSCAAIGEDVSYRWTAKRGDLLENEVAEGNILSINKVTKKNDRKFCCEAFNEESIEKCIRLPPRVLTSSSLELPVSSPATMLCETIGAGVSKLHINWKRADGAPLPKNAVVDDGLLKIPKLARTDAGTYVCVGSSNSEDEAFHSELSLEVVFPPEIDDLIITGLDGDFDNNVTIQCITQRDETMTFEWRAHTEVTTDLRQNEQAKGNIFSIYNFEKGNEGRFCCVATNALGNREKCTTIKRLALEVHPKESHEVFPGSSVTLKCQESGTNSNMKIVWARTDGQPLSRNVVQLADGSLIITDITINEEGHYDCSATKGVLSASATVEIKVKTLPVVQITPSNDGRIIAKLGDELKLTCIGAGHPEPDVQWYKFSNDINTYEVVATVKSGVYEIGSFSEKEAGLYFCLAKNSAGSSNKAVQVVINPPALQIHPAVSQTVMSGSSVTLECHESAGYENIEIHWTREDGRPFASNVVPSANGALIITNIAISEEGSYKCSAKNKVASAFVTTGIKVRTLPEVEIIPSTNGNIIEKLGDKVKLTCTADGHPQPNVQWQKLSPEAESYRPVTPATPNSASYEIESLSENEAGLYLCLAQNAAGSSNKTVRVVIKSFALKVHPSAPEAVMSGSSVALECHESAGYENIEIHWTREDGRPLSSNVVPSASGSLTIKNIAVSEEGRYKCSATKGVLSASATAEIKVKTLPVIEIIPSNDGHITEKLGDKVDLICEAEAHPQPSVEWQKFSTKTNSYQTVKSANPKSAVHEILSLTTNEAGRYRCSATNSAGSSHKTVEIKIEQPVLGAYLKAQSQTVPSGSSVTLECHEYAGFSNMNYKWAREDGHKFASNVVQLANGSLEIVNITINERGRYKCSASNGKASAFATVDIEVDTPISNIEIKRQFPSAFLATMTCQAIGGKASYKWTAENGNLLENEVVEGNQLSVDIHSSKANKNRKYCCEAFNTAGNYKKCQKFPHRVVHSNHITGHVGDSVAIGCTIIGAESLQLNDIKWKKTDGSSLPENAIADDDRLTIPKLAKTDAGTYACVGTYTANGALYTFNEKTSLTVNSF